MRCNGWGDRVIMICSLQPFRSLRVPCLRYGQSAQLTCSLAWTHRDSKNHFLVFLLHSNCLHPQKRFGLTFAPQTNPASPAVFQIFKQINLCLSRIFPLPFKLFPVYQFFLAVARNLANFGVRLYVSIVAGGSTTTTTIPRHMPVFTNSQRILLNCRFRLESPAEAGGFYPVSWWSTNRCHRPNTDNILIQWTVNS